MEPRPVAFKTFIEWNVIGNLFMDHLGNIKRYLVVICSNLRNISTIPSDLQKFALKTESFCEESGFRDKKPRKLFNVTLRRSYSDVFIKSMAREKEFAVTPRKRLQYQNNLFISRQSSLFWMEFLSRQSNKSFVVRVCSVCLLKCSSRIWNSLRWMKLNFSETYFCTPKTSRNFTARNKR